MHAGQEEQEEQEEQVREGIGVTLEYLEKQEVILVTITSLDYHNYLVSIV